ELMSTGVENNVDITFNDGPGNDGTGKTSNIRFSNNPECLTRDNEKLAQEFMLPSPENTVNICDLGETGAIGSSGSS
ncbi:6947_t:CDS:2, partial [Cetraspora pellucida]